MTAKAKVSNDIKRFSGIKRDYTPSEVERLRGSIKIEYSMCKNQSKKLWELLNSEPYINTLGSFNRPHSHSGSIISGVFYITTPPNSGNLIFQQFNNL